MDQENERALLLELTGQHHQLAQQLRLLQAEIRGVRTAEEREAEQCTGRGQKRGRADKEETGVGQARVGNEKRKKNAVLSPDAQVRYDAQLNEWMKDENSATFLCSYLRDFFVSAESDESDGDDEKGGVDERVARLQQQIKALTPDEEARLYIAMLERTCSLHGGEIERMKEKHTQLDRTLFVVKGDLENQIIKTGEQYRITNEWEHRVQMQTENEERWRKWIKQVEEQRDDALAKVAKMKDKLEEAAIQLEREREKQGRTQETLEAEVHRLKEELDEIGVENMSAMEQLKRENVDRVKRHDDAARAHLRKKEEEWQAKIQGGYQIAQFSASQKIAHARSVLDDCIQGIKNECSIAEIEIPIPLQQLLDSASMTLAINGGLPAVPQQRNRPRQQQQTPSPQRADAGGV